MTGAITDRPYRTFWFAIPIVLVISLVQGNDHVFDINTHDSYLVLTSFHMGVGASFCLGCIGGLYWLLRNKKLLKWFTIIHVVVTIFIPVILIATLNYYNYTFIDPKESQTLGTLINTTIFYAACIWILSQILLVVNFFYGLTRQKVN